MPREEADVGDEGESGELGEAGEAGEAGDLDLALPERILLAHLRAGLLDAEIAVRLGLSTGEVKARIERLAANVGVPDRAALRAWDGRPPAPPPPFPGRDEAAPRRRRTMPRIATAVVAAGVVLAAVFASLLLGREDGGGETSARTSASATSTPASPAPAASRDRTAAPVGQIGAVPVRELTLAAPAPLPSGLVLYLYSDIGSNGLTRVSGRAGTSPKGETRFTPKEGRIREAAMAPDGYQLAVLTCQCVAGSPFPPLGRVQLQYSSDGGITWRQLADLEGDWRISYVLPAYEAGVVLVRGEEAILVAAGDGAQTPVPLPGEGASSAAGVLSLGGDRFTTLEGEVVPLPGLGPTASLGAVAIAGGGSALLQWAASDPFEGIYFGTSTAGALDYAAALPLPREGSLIAGSLLQALSPRLGLAQWGIRGPGELYRVSRPVLIDLARLQVIPIADVVENQALRHVPQYLLGGQQGRTVRITAFPCAEARVRPSSSERPLACFARDVLLAQSFAGPGSSADWVSVVPPGGGKALNLRRQDVELSPP